MFFARSVIIVEGPGEALLLPTIAKVLGHSFTDYGTSLVDVRSTGLRRYAKIFQRKGNSGSLNINVACVTDRDIMPDCAPGICIDERYADKRIWPAKNKRKWHAEADYNGIEAADYLNKIRDKASGQSVKTYIADHWTLEYDLAYAGLDNPTMHDVLIKSLGRVNYVDKNFDERVTEISQKIDACHTKEEKASWFYKYFKKLTSKADFAQELSIAIEKEYTDKIDDLKKVLPPYLVEAIEYVTEDN
jgi:putative ATP-dependent endonuclease of OLD family